MQVYYGGPCGRGTANILHICSEIEGATQIIEGLYLGGFESVNNLFRLGQVDTQQAQILVGCSAWMPGQLQDEMRAGCWYVVAASSHFLHECIFGQHGPSTNHRDDVWHRVLTQAGVDPH